MAELVEINLLADPDAIPPKPKLPEAEVERIRAVLRRLGHPLGHPHKYEGYVLRLINPPDELMREIHRGNIPYIYWPDKWADFVAESQGSMK